MARAQATGRCTCRYTPERGDFRPYARTYADGELDVRGLKLLRLGVDPAEVPKRLGVSAERWREMVLACSQRVVAYEVEDELRHQSRVYSE